MSFHAAEIGALVEPVQTWNPCTRPHEKFQYLDLSSVDQAAKEITAAASIVGEDAPSRARQLVRSGDILVSTVRPNLNGVAPVCERFDGATASTGFCVLRPNKKKLDTTYLKHWVRSPLFIACMVREATGASYPAVSDRIVKASHIPLPPLHEQRRIAAILDKADTLRRKRKRALDLLDSLTHSTFLEMFGEGDQAKHTGRDRLGNLLLGVDSGWSPVCLDRAAKIQEAGVLKLSCIGRSGYIPAENKALPSTTAPKKHLEVAAGDVLFARKNTKELVGASVYIWDTRPRLFLSDLIFRLRPKESFLDSLFLQVQLSSERKRKELSALAGGVAGSMPNISKARLAELEVLVAPLSSQAVFRAACEKNHAMILSTAKALFAVNQLFTSLQFRAFSGQL